MWVDVVDSEPSFSLPPLLSLPSLSHTPNNLLLAFLHTLKIKQKLQEAFTDLEKQVERLLAPLSPDLLPGMCFPI